MRKSGIVFVEYRYRRSRKRMRECMWSNVRDSSRIRLCYRCMEVNVSFVGHELYVIHYRQTNKNMFVLLLPSTVCCILHPKSFRQRTPEIREGVHTLNPTVMKDDDITYV